MNWSWNQSRVDEFMQHVATGFVPPSPLELLLQCTALFAVIFAYSYFYRRMKARQRLARETYSEERFTLLCLELRLPPGDRALLRRMAEYLDHPREELHTLLRDRGVFEKAAADLLSSEYQQAESARAARPLTALAIRLGFKPRGSGRIVRSTGDLPVDTILYLDEEPVFRVLDVHPTQLDVELLRDLPANWKKRRNLELNFRRREGYYKMETEIVAIADATPQAGTRAVLTHHAGRVRRRQNRAYFRRDIRLSVRVVVEPGSFPAHTINLSGGGMLLELDADSKNTPVAINERYRPGDILELGLELAPRTLVRCAARVIAVQVQKRRLQLEFTRIDGADRDRIVRLLFGEENKSVQDEQNRLSTSPVRPIAAALLRSARACVVALALELVATGELVASPREKTEFEPQTTTQQNLPNGLPSADLGDYYYTRENYDLARIEYERRLVHRSDGRVVAESTQSPEATALRAKLGLTMMRTQQFRESLTVLNDRRDFSHLYLRMFASLRSGWAFQGLNEESRILDRDDFTAAQKDQARLLGGTVYLESGEYDRVRAYYSNLQAAATDDEVRALSGKLLTSLDGYESLDRKNPYLAAGFSTVLPGAGQIYAGHAVDGVTAFFFNGMFLGSAAIMYDLENRSDSAHLGSGIFGVIGLVFYLANVSGAYQTAHRYNAFQERKFHQEVRDAFFHLDYIQKTSGVVFETNF